MVQLYTLRALDEPPAQTFARIADTPLNGVEFGLNTGTPIELHEPLEETGLVTPNIMAGVEALEDPEDKLVDACRTLDCDTVILGYLDESYFESAATVKETATMLSRFVRSLDEYGLRFLYHNHDHEFIEVEGRTAFDILVEETDKRIGFELDLGWIGAGGDGPYARLKSLGNRVPSVHVKDIHFESAEFAELGRGDPDIQRAVKIAREQAVEWVIHENDQPTDAEASLLRGAAMLDDAVRATHPKHAED
jgi:sugar phosphate isomerase/epimerase